MVAQELLEGELGHLVKVIMAERVMVHRFQLVAVVVAKLQLVAMLVVLLEGLVEMGKRLQSQGLL